MNKDFRKLLFKIIILIIVLWVIFAFTIKKLSMRIFDDEYPYYKQTVDYIDNQTDYNKVVVMGDSVAKAAILPKEMSDKTYNLAMAGSSPIEQYYLLQRYVKNHGKPDTVIMMYFIGGYDESIEGFFWNRTVYFDCLELSEINDVVSTGLFPNGMKAVFDYWMYKLKSPTKYYAALKNAMYEDRGKINQANYEAAVESKGQHYFGDACAFHPNNITIDARAEFKPSEVYEYYLDRCLSYCRDNDIQVLFLTHPINISTLTNMQDTFRMSYLDYMKELVDKYPGIVNDIIEDFDFHFDPDSWFGDATHLNEEGAKAYTKKIKEKYSQYLID